MHTCLVAQLCRTLCNPLDCSLSGSSVHGISQARILEWVAISLSRGTSRSRDQTWVSRIGRWILYHWATWIAHLAHTKYLINNNSVLTITNLGYYHTFVSKLLEFFNVFISCYRKHSGIVCSVSICQLESKCRLNHLASCTTLEKLCQNDCFINHCFRF